MVAVLGGHVAQVGDADGGHVVTVEAGTDRPRSIHATLTTSSATAKTTAHPRSPAADPQRQPEHRQRRRPHEGHDGDDTTGSAASRGHAGSAGA
jgi:hypothetical protein